MYAVTPGGSASLLVAKTKLAPIKVQTIPRLELFAATLFTRLARNFLDKLRHPPARIFCWTNSSVVFEWIKGHPSRWPTFVANRVNEIQTTLPDARWRHVRTEDNPADCATRGLTPRELAAFSLWWAGPAWISCGEETWPSMTTQASNAQVVLAMVTGCEKARPAVVDATAVTECLPDLCKYSNFHRIISVIYHFYRWHFRANKRAADGSKLLDADIWRKARWCCFKVIQAHHFKEEIQAIKNKKPISRRSHLARLAPMFGRDELLRVGGRLQNAQLSYDETHPIILPGECIIVRRLIEYEHREETMHGGAQLMRSQLARQFWITRGERIVQSVCRACIKCTRYRAVPVEQQMAPLPAVRVTPARAFKSIGLDYAGPLPVLFSRAKKANTSKGYVAIFICLVTRAVHIEIVSDLTADAFLAAYA
uniref:Integrase zinc-binding domain-containing protein n=1 Tax=Trichogramma kaykai TaxID=54128 RepID=A0ABD2W2Z8_9HYME